MMQLCYLLIVKPHADKATHYMEIFNEIVLLGAIYFLPLFTDMVANGALRSQMGWWFNIMLLIPLFGANLVYVFFMGIRRTCEEMRNACSKKKKAVVVVADKMYDDADKFGIEASEKKAINKQNLEVVVEELPDAEEYEAAIEKESFLQAMQKRGLDLKTIEKDGNCVFRSIGLLLFEDQAKHMQVRHDIVNQLIEKREKYSKKISFSQGLETFDAYVENMRMEGIWGDHVELQAAADMYGVDINVYTVGSGVQRPNMIVECTGEIEYLPISLWFEDDCHYHAFTDSATSAEPAMAPEDNQEEQIDILEM